MVTTKQAMQDGNQAPYRIVAPSGPALPVVLSSPHSGRWYPPALLTQLRLAPELLRGLDDGPVDELLALACDAGATLIAATYPRAVVDLKDDEVVVNVVEKARPGDKKAADENASAGDDEQQESAKTGTVQADDLQTDDVKEGGS